MNATHGAENRRSTRFGTLAVTAVGATLLGAVVAIGPAAGSAQAESASRSCTGALVVVPGTFDPGGNDMRRIWDLPDRADHEHVLVEYPATLWPLGAIGYNADVRMGHDMAVREIQDYRNACPDAPIEIVGWSQGARIAGDVLSDIGNGRVEGVESDNVSGVLYSDPRQTGTVTGRGIELSMIGLLPGLTMTGAREGGFGDVSGDVTSVCAQRDGICDLPDPLHDPIGVLDGLIGYVTRHTVYPDVMNTRIDPDTTTGTWLDELECSDQGTHGTVCLHRPGSALSGVVRDAATAIGLRGERLPDLMVLRPRVPGTILPGVDLAGVQRPIATIFALLPELPNLTHHAGGHLPDLFAFTDVLEGVITLDEDKFRAGTSALGESVVSIVRIPRNQARHFYDLFVQARGAREAARAVQDDQIDAATDVNTGEEQGTQQETGQTTGSETPVTTTSLVPDVAASATDTQDPGTTTPQTPSAPAPSPAPDAPSQTPDPQESAAPEPESSQTPTPEVTADAVVTETDDPADLSGEAAPAA